MVPSPQEIGAGAGAGEEDGVPGHSAAGSQRRDEAGEPGSGAVVATRSADPRLAPVKAMVRRVLSAAPDPFVVRFWDGDELAIGGPGAPRFTIVLRDPRALAGTDEDSIGRAYIDGHWDIEGDPRGAFALRRFLTVKSSPFSVMSLLARIFLVRAQKNNTEAISAHYSLGDDFYLSFLDTKYRIYSHGHFRHEQETLEESQEHKLQDMYDMLELKPGMRLLDIGGGWGPVPQFCGERGVKVTSVTLAPDSHRFISRLIAERKLPCDVVLTDFLDYRPERPFDAIVIYGVIEHIPQYRRFVRHVWDLLPPGGLMYLDGSATRWKYDMNRVIKDEVWPTTTAYLATHDLIAELNYHGMDLLELKNESKDYELTMLHWSRRFEAARDLIVGRWGERLYRIFRMYLWGGHLCFVEDQLQAYRMLIRRSPRRGPRPGRLTRALYHLWGSE